MKSLIAEDDFVSRKILQDVLSKYGESNVAIDGEEALQAFKDAFENNAPYDLVCLDIMMPIMDGRDTLRNIRAYEDKKGVEGLDRTKVIMTTAVDDPKSIIGAFREQCEYYMVKPIKIAEFTENLKELKLIE